MLLVYSPEIKAWLTALPLLIYISLHSGTVPVIEDMSAVVGNAMIDNFTKE